MSSFFRGKPFCIEMSLTFVSSALTVLLLECSTALTVGEKHVSWEDSHWFRNTATNRKTFLAFLFLFQDPLKFSYNCYKATFVNFHLFYLFILKFNPPCRMM